MTIHSHAVRAFAAVDIAGACQRYLKDRTDKEAELMEQHIKYEMNKPWWKSPAKTRDDAIKACMVPLWGYSWEIGGTSLASRVADLLVLAEASGDEQVYVSAELFECIARFYGSKQNDNRD